MCLYVCLSNIILHGPVVGVARVDDVISSGGFAQVTAATEGLSIRRAKDVSPGRVAIKVVVTRRRKK